MANNCVYELQSGSSSPTYDEWGMNRNSRDSFEPVPLFGSNSDESVGTGRTQRYETADPSGGLMGEKRSLDKLLHGMPSISRRKKKAKGIPKRPMSAYALFFSRERSNLLEAESDIRRNQSLSFEELEKMIGMRWRGLTVEERKKYDCLASEDSVRYRNEMEAFNDEKQKQKSVLPPQADAPRNDPPSISPPLPHSSVHRHRMGMYMPPPSPSSSRAGRLVYGHPLYARLPGRHRHPYPSEHYPPPYPSMSSLNAQGYPNEPPLHYYTPPVVSSAHALPPTWMSCPYASPPQTFPSVAMNGDLFPIPPGMELLLPDREGRERKYRVEYACYTMSREAARDYVDRLSNAISHGGPPPPPPLNPGLDEEGDQWAARPPAWDGSF